MKRNCVRYGLLLTIPMVALCAYFCTESLLSIRTMILDHKELHHKDHIIPKLLANTFKFIREQYKGRCAFLSSSSLRMLVNV